MIHMIILSVAVHSIHDGLILAFNRNIRSLATRSFRNVVWRRNVSTLKSDDGVFISKSNIDIPLKDFLVVSRPSGIENSTTIGYISKFLNPLECTSIINSCNTNGKYRYKSDGGYLDAERKRLTLSSEVSMSNFPEVRRDCVILDNISHTEQETIIRAIEVQTLEDANNGTSSRLQSDGVRKFLGSILSMETNHVCIYPYHKIE